MDAEPLTPEKLARMERDARQVVAVFSCGSNASLLAHEVLALVAECRRLADAKYPEAAPNREARRARRAVIRRRMRYESLPGEEGGGS